MDFRDTIAYMIGLDSRNYSLFEFQIIGSSGRINIVDNGRRIEVYQSKKSTHFSGYEELKPHSFTNSEDSLPPMYNALDEIIKTLDGKAHLRSDGQTALITLATCNQIIKESERLWRK